MKKCPKCMKSDLDTVRFCKSCGTEIFFLERFESAEEKAKGADSTDSKQKLFFIILSMFILIVFFIPCYSIEAVIKEYFIEDGSVTIGEITETFNGNFSGFQLALINFRLNFGFGFAFFIPLLFPIVAFIKIFKSRDLLVNKSLYVYLSWVFTIGIIITVALFYIISALGKQTGGQDLTAIQITDLLFFTEYFDTAGFINVAVEMSVLPVIGWFLSLLFYLIGIVFSVFCFRKAK